MQRTRDTVDRAMPVRAFWCWPAGFALVGLVEAYTHFSRFGGGVGSLLLAVACAAVTGFGLGVVGLLLAVLAQRRGWRRRPGPETLADAATVASASAVVLIATWWGIDAALETTRARPIDAPEAETKIAQGLAALVVPIAVLAVWSAMRALKRGLQRPSAGRWVLRGSLLVLAVVVLRHFCGGPFALQFGAWAPLVCVGLATLAAAAWLPAQAPATRRARVVWGASATVVLAAGLVGAQHVGARALLFHDARVFPQIHTAMTAFLDGDRDGELPVWVGGRDCDDASARIATWRPELPGNGIDDNCADGDAPEVAPRPTVANPDAPHPSIVLITIDGVRADHLELWGYARPTMPNVAAFAQKSRWWRNAWAPSNHTMFSMFSMLSGQSPEFLVREPDVLDSGGTKFTFWLPHRLAQLGYASAAINPALVVSGDITPQELRFEELHMGPWDFQPKNRGTQARQVAAFTVDWLARRRDDRPLFLWVHFHDPHARHEAPARFGATSTLDLYDDELSWVDYHLAPVFAAIDETLGPDSIVAVTSDHGESFGERGAFGHGFSLYEAVLHVPLIIRASGLEPGPIDVAVSLTGLAATLLDLVGVDAGSRPTSNSFARTDAQHPVVAAAPFFWSEQRMSVALRDGAHKLVHNRRMDTYLLFDLAEDPEERSNLAPTRPDLLVSMRATMARLLEQSR